MNPETTFDICLYNRHGEPCQTYEQACQVVQCFAGLSFASKVPQDADAGMWTMDLPPRFVRKLTRDGYLAEEKPAAGSIYAECEPFYSTCRGCGEDFAVDEEAIQHAIKEGAPTRADAANIIDVCPICAGIDGAEGC